MYIIHSELKCNFENNSYCAKSLDKFGFIHCSDLDTYYLVAPNFKDENKERIIIVINTDKLISDLKYEDGGGIYFPHIYGIINNEAIEEVLPHLWSNNKEWIPNEELKKYLELNKLDNFKRKI